MHTVPHTEESQTPVTAEPTRKPLILVVDPDDSTRSVLEMALVRDGFDVWTAAGRTEGMVLLSGRLPDVIVLESDLGGDDGFTFVAELRGSERLSKLPVLLLARPDDANVEAMADVVGADDFLQKPAFARDVAAMVRVELARRGDPRSMWFDSAVLPPVQLLRALLSCPRSGRLMLVEGRAEIRFRGGKVIDARFDGKGSDLDTVVRSLALTDGEYELKLEPVNGFAELQCGLRELVELVSPRLQRWAKVLDRSLPLESQLTVDFARLSSALKSMPDEVNKIVQLFDGFRTVERVLLDSEFPETLTLEVATRLYLMGVLAPMKGSASDLVFLRPMPRLFEPRAAEAEELMQQLFEGKAEIRGDEGGPGQDEDWTQAIVGETGLELSDPRGGWTTAPVPQVLADGLEPELAAQLDAFQTPMQVEAKELPVEQQPVDRFVQRENANASSETAIEVALQQAADTAPVTLADPALDDDMARFRAQARGSQARIETPWMTPVVNPETLPAPVVETRPEEAPRPVEPTVVVAPAEAAFFGSDEATAELDEEPVAPARSTRRVWPFVVGALCVGALVLTLDALISPSVEPVAAPVEAPVVVTPVVVAPPANLPDIEEPEFIEEELTPVVDISENLDESRKLYEAGQYKKALSVLEAVLVDAPTSLPAWNLYALAKYDSGDIAGAKAATQKILELDPKNARVQILIASMHLDANEKDLGRAALEKYLELDPQGPHAEEAKALLKR